MWRVSLVLVPYFSDLLARWQADSLRLSLPDLLQSRHCIAFASPPLFWKNLHHLSESCTSILHPFFLPSPTPRLGISDQPGKPSLSSLSSFQTHSSTRQNEYCREGNYDLILRKNEGTRGVRVKLEFIRDGPLAPHQNLGTTRQPLFTNPHHLPYYSFFLHHDHDGFRIQW